LSDPRIASLDNSHPSSESCDSSRRYQFLNSLLAGCQVLQLLHGLEPAARRREGGALDEKPA